MLMKDKTVVGLVEKIMIRGQSGRSRIVAGRIDTGATKSSIDETLATELQVGPVVGTRIVRQAQGRQRRPVVHVKLRIKGRMVEGDFTVADRSHMRFPVLIGQNILSQDFLVDPSLKMDE